MRASHTRTPLYKIKTSDLEQIKTVTTLEVHVVYPVSCRLVLCKQHLIISWWHSGNVFKNIMINVSEMLEYTILPFTTHAHFIDISLTSNYDWNWKNCLFHNLINQTVTMKSISLKVTSSCCEDHHTYFLDIRMAFFSNARSFQPNTTNKFTILHHSKDMWTY